MGSAVRIRLRAPLHSEGGKRFYQDENGHKNRYSDQELLDYDQVVFKDASEQKDLHDKFFGYDFDSDPDKG